MVGTSSTANESRMSTNTTEGNQCYSHDRASTVSEAIESFVSATTEALADCGADEDTVAAVEEQGNRLATVVDADADADLDDQEDADNVEDDVDDEQTATVQWDTDDADDLKVVSSDGTTFPLGLSISSKVSETDLDERLDDVEDRLSTDEPYPSEGEEPPVDDCVTPQTPLEQTVGLPEDMVSNESANVQRAVFIASDVQDYTTSVPAGRAITSGELRRVLKAGTDCNGHSQTVDRVITVLDDLGGDDVKVVKRRGERRIVFDEELCHRLKELSQDERDANHGVVSGGRA